MPFPRPPVPASPSKPRCPDIGPPIRVVQAPKPIKRR